METTNDEHETETETSARRGTSNDPRVGQAGNVAINNNGHIIQNVYNGPSTFMHTERERLDLVTVLNPILDASHTRNLSLSPPNSRCFPGTRKKVLKRIRKWIDSSLILSRPHIIWIYGYAGCGKSAIAQAVCNHFAEQGRLAAAFFFFRNAGDRSNIARFATTVASQVAAAIPATAPFIEAAIKANPGFLSTTNTSLSDQFDQLIYQPIDKSVGLAALMFGKPFLIALDGLDECGDHDDVAAFIERMIAFFERKPTIPLRFLITSRVENHIHNHLHSSPQVELLNLVEHTSDADILTALDAAIEVEKRGLVLACAALWPSAEEKAKLVKHIGGSYIFLTTIVKLLFDPYTKDGLTPMERLPLILGLTYALLDGIKIVPLPVFQPAVQGRITSWTLPKRTPATIWSCPYIQPFALELLLHDSHCNTDLYFIDPSPRTSAQVVSGIINFQLREVVWDTDLSTQPYESAVGSTLFHQYAFAFDGQRPAKSEVRFVKSYRVGRAFRVPRFSTICDFPPHFWGLDGRIVTLWLKRPRVHGPA